MSKEYLEAFERMIEHLDLEDEYSYKQLFEDEEIIKKALQRLESIDNSKSSEALEFLETIKTITELEPLLERTKQVLLKAKEWKKVLKIVFKKQVDINEIKILLVNLKHCDDIERCKRYNASRKVGYKLKQEEFNLLKEYCNGNI